MAGIEADTADEAFVADVARAFGSTVAQARPDVAFYVHRISHETAPTMPPVAGDGLAARIDRQWQAMISSGELRDRVVDGHRRGPPQAARGPLGADHGRYEP